MPQRRPKGLTGEQIQKAMEKHDKAETCECLYDSGNKMCDKPTHVVVEDNGEGWESSFGKFPDNKVPRYVVRRPLCLEHSKQFDVLKPTITISEFVRGYNLAGEYLEGRERKTAAVKQYTITDKGLDRITIVEASSRKEAVEIYRIAQPKTKIRK